MLFSVEIFSTFKTKKFPKGSIVYSFSSRGAFIITEERVNAVRFFEEKEYIAPYTFIPGDIVGFYRNNIIEDSKWDFLAETDVQVIFIPEKIIKDVVFNNLELYRFFSEAAANNWKK